jgi:hypothetical protein
MGSIVFKQPVLALSLFRMDAGVVTALSDRPPQSLPVVGMQGRPIDRSVHRRKKNEGTPMIIALVQFRLPSSLSLEEAREIFSGTAPKYRNIPGLLRKNYILSQDGGTAGGIYLWNSQAQAESFYSHEWKQFIIDKYGAPPSVTYFDSPVMVDNVAGEIVADEKIEK